MTDRPSDRRSQIIAAALRLVAREGAALVTTRKIAHEANVNLGTLHYLFTGKDALLLDALTEVTGQMMAALAEAGAATSLTAALSEAWQALLALVDGEPELPLVRCELLLYLQRHPAYAEAARAECGRYRAALAALHDGWCPDDERAAGCLVVAELTASLVDGMALQRAAVADGGWTIRQTREYALRSVLGLAAEHRAARVAAIR
jgi:AcrR family transcriptional regulator